MKTILLFLFTGLTSFFMVQAQITVELRDAYTFEPINGLSFKTQAKLSQQTNAVYKVEAAQFPITIEFSHPDYDPYLLAIPANGAAYAIVVYMVPNTQTENETVVSANRTAEKRKDVAQKIQVVRAAEIQFQQQTSMADVLANSGSIFVQKSQLGGGSPIIRGFETNKVLLVVDGIRMNNAIYRGGHLQNVLTLDQANMDRVELVFGPGSVMYGSDAIGGVMSFQTKNQFSVHLINYWCAAVHTCVVFPQVLVMQPMRKSMWETNVLHPSLPFLMRHTETFVKAPNAVRPLVI